MSCNQKDKLKMKLEIYKGLNYSVTEINKSFKIKVAGIYNNKKINTLVGVYGLIKIVGQEMVNKMLSKAFKSKDDVVYIKLRRGIKVSFYNH